nr:anti-sigma factor antagonist [Thermoanaerobacterales bacterium]
MSPVASDPCVLEVVDRSDHGVVARLSGDLDIVTAERITAELAALIEAGHERVTLDVGGLGFVDSSGLGALVTVHRRAQAHDGSLVLRSVPPRVRRLLEITRLDELLAIEGE